MITCRDICDRATDHLDGNASLSQRIALRFHLLICKGCRRFVHQFQLTIGVASSLGSTGDPTDEEIDSLVERLVRVRNQ
ncbi:MAG: zf-HC2 domain-containing protein [Gammaproteobacteria bacterium]|nr:zf-HC2 domain-containing protein [Gammaproteobacteria bacterium]MBT4495082.1 zf-HC2 domain-containing protein [Gammaproteobacteria bacterium]MBT7370199.1 zf-HC2 domain-containing protein [Gammaproteobacteria bacterium]